MHVLQFAPRVCWPLDTGAKLRNFHLARALSQRVKVTHLAFADRDPPLGTLRDVYDQVVTVKQSPGYTPTKILRGALGRTPLTVLNYTTDAMMRMLERVLAEQQFDVVQVEGSQLAAYLPIIRAAKCRPMAVCDWHNIESEVMRRYAEREASNLRKKYAKRTARQLLALEQQAGSEFDAHLTVSERDGARVRELVRDARVFVIENGVDPDYYSDAQIETAYSAWPNRSGPDGTKRRLLFVGSMDYHANIDAAVNFARTVWPELVESHDELTYTIVGKDPSPEVLELSSNRGIEITGTVEDVRPYYRDAVAAIVPLRVGGGSRLKILEAMAAGVPVIATTVGAEGLAVSNRENIVIANTNEEMREAIARIAEDSTLRSKLRGGGRVLVSQRYDWSAVGDSLFRAYEELLSVQRPR